MDSTAIFAMSSQAALRKLSPDWLAFLDMLNDGSDGAYTAPSGTTTLTSDIYRYSSLTIGSGNTLTANGNYLVLLVNGTAQIDGTLTMSGKGGAGATTLANAPALTGVNAPNYIAGAGGGGGGGQSGANPYSGYSGASTQFAGGANANGSGAAGNGGSATKIGVFYQDLPTILATKGGGGGIGGYSASSGNQYGGAGAGIIILVAKTIQGAGAVRSDGIAGTNTAAGVNLACGGGGGGGGGVVILVNNGAATSITASASGGAGAAGYASGSGYTASAGGNGGNGVVLKMGR